MPGFVLIVTALTLLSIVLAAIALRSQVQLKRVKHALQQEIASRQQAEQTLWQSEDRFREFMNNSPTAAWITDADGQILYMSQTYFRMFQLPTQDAIGKSIFELYPTDIAQPFLENIRRVVETNQAVEAIELAPRPDGMVGDFLVYKFPMLDASGQNVVGGVAIDITERRRAEEALRMSEERFRSLSACSPVGIYLADPNGYGIYTNPRCQEIFGFTAEESLGTGWADLVHPDDREWLLQDWMVAASAGQPSIAEYRIQPQLGVIKWVETRTAPMLSDQGDLIGHVGTIEDISDRKRVEDDRKQSEAAIQQLNKALEQQNLELEVLVEQRTEELLTFINALPDYIFVVERDTMRMPFCNDLLARTTGANSRLDVQGKTIFECFAPEQAAYFAEQNRQVFESGQTLHVQESFPLATGMLYLDTYKIPLKQPNSEVYALIGTCRDITELVKARQALTERSQQLEATNRELESFSYSVSHDLRTPLRHINGFVAALSQQLARSRAEADPKVSHYLRIIEDSSQKMGLLIDGLLTLSHVGRQHIERRPVNLRGLVDQAICLVRETTDVKDAVEFVVGELPTVSGDAALLQQVFSNLIDNAVKFSHVGTASPNEHRNPARIEVGALADGTVFVKDNGVGFQMEYADQLFGAFQRLHPRSTFEGTGIGLAIAQRILHRHNGTIWAESQPGQGACFYFRVGPSVEERIP